MSGLGFMVLGLRFGVWGGLGFVWGTTSPVGSRSRQSGCQHTGYRIRLAGFGLRGWGSGLIGVLGLGFGVWGQITLVQICSRAGEVRDNDGQLHGHCFNHWKAPTLRSRLGFQV